MVVAAQAPRTERTTPSIHPSTTNSSTKNWKRRSKEPETPPTVKSLNVCRGFNWLAYIAGSVRHAGYRDQREVQERTHDVATKLLIGMLFRGFDERTSGPMDLRFKRSVSNAIRNMTELERNRRRLLPDCLHRSGVRAGGRD